MTTQTKKLKSNKSQTDGQTNDRRTNQGNGLRQGRVVSVHLGVVVQYPHPIGLLQGCGGALLVAEIEGVARVQTARHLAVPWRIGLL
jgi:hypothetical protein